MSGLDVILIRVHANGVEITLGGCLKHTFPRAAGNLIDNIGAFVILTKRSLKPKSWVGEIKTKIADQYFAIRTDFQHALLVAVKELVQAWSISTDNSTDSLCFGQRTDN